MEPVSTVLTVVEAFKEVYLLAKFVYKTAQSASHFKEEEKDLVDEFEGELLYLGSFWTVFTKSDGSLIEDDVLNPQLLQWIENVVERLHVHFIAYTRLAVKYDEDYRQYSPYNPSSTPRPITDFPADRKISERKINPERKSGYSNSWLSKIRGNSYAVSQGATRAIEGLKWSLHRKEKFEALLAEVKKWVQKLVNFIPIILDSVHSKKEHGMFLKPAKDAKRDIFEPHVLLREFAHNPQTAVAQAMKLRSVKAPLSTTPRQLVEQKFFDVNNPDTEQYVAQLAMLLSTAGSRMFRTLPLKEYMSDEEQLCYKFYFDYPSEAADVSPQSLYELLGNQRSDSRSTLSIRFRIAQAIAQSIGAFHADGWVHKSIRSHAIKFFSDKARPEKLNLRLPYLTEFEFSRPEGGLTSRAEGDPDLERSVYRHPDRDGPPSIDFNKAHDIYSLGVVLLEIGMWEDAVTIYQKLMKSLQKKANGGQPTPESVKRAMRTYANLYLPHKMGDAYSEVVDVCLSNEFHKRLGQEEFALTFERRVVEMLDVKKLDD